MNRVIRIPTSRYEAILRCNCDRLKRLGTAKDSPLAKGVRDAGMGCAIPGKPTPSAFATAVATDPFHGGDFQESRAGRAGGTPKNENGRRSLELA